jgi:hypothetical protein
MKKVTPPVALTSQIRKREIQTEFLGETCCRAAIWKTDTKITEDNIKTSVREIDCGNVNYTEQA